MLSENQLYNTKIIKYNGDLLITNSIMYYDFLNKDFGLIKDVYPELTPEEINNHILNGKVSLRSKPITSKDDVVDNEYCFYVYRQMVIKPSADDMKVIYFHWSKGSSKISQMNANGLINYWVNNKDNLIYNFNIKNEGFIE